MWGFDSPSRHFKQIKYQKSKCKNHEGGTVDQMRQGRIDYDDRMTDYGDSGARHESASRLGSLSHAEDTRDERTRIATSASPKGPGPAGGLAMTQKKLLIALLVLFMASLPAGSFSG